MSADLVTVDSLLERWEELREQGIEPCLQELAGDQPDLVEPLRQRIAALEAMDWLQLSAEVDTAGCGKRATPCGSRPKPVRELSLPPTLADRYRLESLLGDGGFGQVWRAHDTTLERSVAVKITTVDCIHEARRVAQLKHEGIVQVHDVGKHDEFCFIVFDFVGDDDLGAEMQRRAFSWREAAEMTAKVADNLQFAHDRGIIHRDIKPANILLTDDGKPVLADFGIAVTRSEIERETITTAGTMAYMAPEQLDPVAGNGDRSTNGGGSNDTSLGPATDLYSLGVVFYQMLCDRMPFDAPTLWDLRQQILAGRPTPPHDIDSKIPRAVSEACLQCLAVSPRDRFASADALAVRLRSLLENDG